MNWLILYCFCGSITFILSMKGENLHLRAKRSLFKLDKMKSKSEEYFFWESAFKTLDESDSGKRLERFRKEAENVRLQNRRIDKWNQVFENGDLNVTTGNELKGSYFWAIKLIGIKLQQNRNRILDSSFEDTKRKAEMVYTYRYRDLKPGTESFVSHEKTLKEWGNFVTKIGGNCLTRKSRSLGLRAVRVCQKGEERKIERGQGIGNGQGIAKRREIAKKRGLAKKTWSSKWTWNTKKISNSMKKCFPSGYDRDVSIE